MITYFEILLVNAYYVDQYAHDDPAHTLNCTLHMVASYPGPTQLFIAWSGRGPVIFDDYIIVNIVSHV